MDYPELHSVTGLVLVITWAAMRFLYAGLVDRVECRNLDECLAKDTDGIRPLHKQPTYLVHGQRILRKGC